MYARNVEHGIYAIEREHSLAPASTNANDTLYHIIYVYIQ